MEASMSHPAEPPLCQGPDPDLRPPIVAVPAKSCDTHAHIFGPIARYPLTPQRSYTPPDCPIDAYIELLDRLQIERAVLVQGSAHGFDNSAAYDAIQAYPQRLRGVAVIAPDIGDKELERLHQGGFRGCRMSTMVAGGVGVEALEALAERVRPFDWHLVMHLDRSVELVELAPRLLAGNIDFVIDHLARVRGAEGVAAPGFKTLLRLLQASDRCWVKLSSLYRLSSVPFPHSDMLPMIRAAIAARPDRILWGTNWPHPIHHGPMPKDSDLLELFAYWVGDESLFKRILVDNPAALYDFDTALVRGST